MYTRQALHCYWRALLSKQHCRCCRGPPPMSRGIASPQRLLSADTCSSPPAGLLSLWSSSAHMWTSWKHTGELMPPEVALTQQEMGCCGSKATLCPCVTQ